MTSRTLSNLDADLLCLAFANTLNQNVQERKKAEDLLKQVELAPGLLLLLTKIISSPDIDTTVRSSAAVYLKNELRQHWNPSSYTSSLSVTNGACKEFYTAEEKDAVRNHLLPLLEVVITSAGGIGKGIQGSVQECIRIVVTSDFPENWSGALPWVIKNLGQRGNIPGLQAALLALRQMVAKYELRVSGGRNELVEIIGVTFPLLLTLALDLSKENCMSNQTSAGMIKLICKIYWSATQMALAESEEVVKTVSTWMELMGHIISAPIPSEEFLSVIDTEQRDSLQQFKAKKWAVQIVHRFLSRYGAPKFRDIERTAENELGQMFVKQWASRFAQQFIELFKLHTKGSLCLTDRLINIILQYLSQCLELSATYKTIKLEVPFLLFDVCFPLLCYTSQDVEKWEIDPAEFMRTQGVILSGCSRDSAVQFIQNCVRFRSRDSLQLISNFVQSLLMKHKHSRLEDKQHGLNQQKYGALFMIGCISDRLTSRKRQLEIEPFLIEHVLPELTNTYDPFLRLRSCWTYHQFLDGEKSGLTVFKHTAQLLEAFECIASLCNDKELPVQAEAAMTLRVFANMSHSDVRTAISKQMPILMERLFSIMGQMQDNDMIVVTLECLVLNFEDLVPPFAVELVNNLSKALIRMIDVANGTNDTSDSPTSCSSTIEEDTTLTAMNVAQTITSVMSTITQSQFNSLYEQMAPNLTPLLDKLLSPEGIDFIDDGLAILTYLTFFCPYLSKPTDLWRYFDRMYQAICGGSCYHLELTGVCSHGWAPDYLDKMLPCFDNLISRDIERFVTGISPFNGQTYKQLVLEIVDKTLSSIGDLDSRRYGLELMMLLFEGLLLSSPAIDDLISPCFKLLWNYLNAIKKENTVISRSTMSLAIRQISMMMLYNIRLFLELTESLGVTDDIVNMLFFHTDTIHSLDGKKAVLLASIQLIDLGAQGTLPIGLQSKLYNFIQNMSEQTQQYIESRKKEDENNSEDFYDSDSLDSEQDIGDDEDVTSELPEKLLKKIREVEPFDDDDDDDYSEDEATTDGFPIQESPFDKINEITVLLRLVAQHRHLFEAALGNETIQLLSQQIETENIRRKELEANESSVVTG